MAGWHSAGLAGLNRPDLVWPHHLVVLVLDDVAVPDEPARRLEFRPDADDLAGYAITVSLKPGLSHGAVYVLAIDSAPGATVASFTVYVLRVDGPCHRYVWQGADRTSSG